MACAGGLVPADGFEEAVVDEGEEDGEVDLDAADDTYTGF